MESVGWSTGLTISSLSPPSKSFIVLPDDAFNVIDGGESFELVLARTSPPPPNVTEPDVTSDADTSNVESGG